MARFNFYLKDKYLENDTPIILYIRYEGYRLRYYTGKSIHPKFWNEKDKLVRLVKELPTAKTINDRLKYIKSEAENVMGKFENEFGHLPTTEALKIKLDHVIKEIPESNEALDRMPSFMELFDRFIKESEDGTRLTTSGKKFDKRSIQKYNTVKTVLDKFSKSYHLSFDTIDKNFYSKFVAYLNKPLFEKNSKGEKIQTKKSYSLNNVGKYIQVLKTFLTYATENGYNSNMYFQSKQFKAHKVPGFSIYLNEDEITAIYNLDLSKTPRLERVRDLFIVGCWTGLRFSDFTTIKPENINGNFFHIKTFKTGEKVIIPIFHEMVKEIMAKYKDKYPNSLPPAISNQRMNEYLKEIAMQVDCLKTDVEVERIKGGLETITKAEKHELVVTHTARRSFATNVYKSGFPATSLMKITGHRTEKAFLLYIKVTPEENAQLLLEHWNKLNRSVLKVS